MLAAEGAEVATPEIFESALVGGLLGFVAAGTDVVADFETKAAGSCMCGKAAGDTS